MSKKDEFLKNQKALARRIASGSASHKDIKNEIARLNKLKPANEWLTLNRQNNKRLNDSRAAYKALLKKQLLLKQQQQAAADPNQKLAKQHAAFQKAQARKSQQEAKRKKEQNARSEQLRKLRERAQQQSQQAPKRYGRKSGPRGAQN